jgi:hypothetical protein
VYKNILLDKLPESYKGYLFRTDYRIGMQIDLCLKDNEIEECSKIGICLDLLYGKGIPKDIELAIEGLAWFMRCGNEKKEDTGEENEAIFDFDYDNARLFSAFKKVYEIDLARQNLHWFEFVFLLSDLGDCAFTQIIEYRNADISDMKGKQREAYVKMKKKFALPESYTTEEKEKIDKFLSQLGE